MYKNDDRVVLTLDAGGTNFVFSAMSAGQEIVPRVRVKSEPDNLDACLKAIAQGFRQVQEKVHSGISAISFAFPGPADYAHGIIGDLPNFPAFSSGGVALGPYLEDIFGVPVYINNDGNLYAYGEALCGFLPQINKMLRSRGSFREYRNLIGLTLGTGFGAGVVMDGVLLTGDNGCGGDVWCMRNGIYPDKIAEEGVSIRAVRRVYRELSGDTSENLTPKDIYDIADGAAPGNRQAAVESFRQMGNAAGYAIVNALDIVDGLVVVGGGVSGAAKYIFPGIMDIMRSSLSTFAGDSFHCLQQEVFDLTDPAQLEEFLQDSSTQVTVPFSDRKVTWRPSKKVGIGLSRGDTSEIIAAGAYAYALHRLDTKQ